MSKKNQNLLKIYLFKKEVKDKIKQEKPKNNDKGISNE